MLKRSLTLFLTALILLLSACGTTANGSSGASAVAPSSFTIAYQPGLGAVTIVVLKQQKTLEKLFPNTKFQWKVVFSGSAVREAMIADQAQLGTLGIPPFLVGWDRGFDWKVLSASTRSDSWLVTKNPRIKSLKDFGPNDKIGVVAPDAQQAIALRKAAQQQLGDAHALDKNLVTISSADGEQAYLSGLLAAHLSGSPFQQREVAAGGRVIFHTQDAFGPVGAGVVALRQSFYDQYPDFVNKLYKSYLEAADFASKHHAQAAQYLSQDQAGGGTPAQFKELLDGPTLEFSPTPTGLIAYASFMKTIGLTAKVPASAKDIELPTLNGAGS